MKISEVLARGGVTLTYEVFPPRRDDTYEDIVGRAEQMAHLNPPFMSVTFGAGGGTSDYSVQLAKDIKNRLGVEPLAHLTCVATTRERVHEIVGELKAGGVENILALRGDIPPEGRSVFDYENAAELIADIKSQGDFCIGGACYPEGHPDAVNKAEDLHYLKRKVDAGCDFLITQMFFDNSLYYNFVYRAREVGINVPILAGIMPITNAKQVKRVTQLSGNYLPAKFMSVVDRFGSNPAAMRQAGIAYATGQIIDLIASGVDHIHVFTMNRPEIAIGIHDALSEMVK